MCSGFAVIIAEIVLRGQRLDSAARDTLESNENQNTVRGSSAHVVSRNQHAAAGTSVDRHRRTQALH
jgi:hypothetical protein